MKNGKLLFVFILKVVAFVFEPILWINCGLELRSDPKEAVINAIAAIFFIIIGVALDYKPES